MALGQPSQTEPLVAGGEEASCVLCGNFGAPVVWTENGYRSHACECGVIYTSPVPPADAIDPTVDLHPPSFYARPAPLKARWLRAHRPGGLLLEVGCGDGAFLRAARRCGYDVAGIDANPGLARRTADDLGIEVEAALLENAEWPTGSCDIVFSCDLMSHFADPSAALARMARWLKPGGALFFEVGIVTGADMRWFRMVGEAHLPEHRQFFSEGALATVLARAGLEMEACKRFALAPSFLASECSAVAKLVTSRRRPPTIDVDEAGQRERHRQRVLSFDATAPRRESRAARLRAPVRSFLRYRLGAVAPKAGPLTMLVLARPRPAAVGGGVPSDR